MATVIGMIALPNGEPYTGQIKFFRCDAPAAIGSTLVTGLYDGLVVQTEVNGSFEIELKAGVYKLQIAGSKARTIHLIDDDATYELQTLGVPGFASYSGTGGGARGRRADRPCDHRRIRLADAVDRRRAPSYRRRQERRPRPSHATPGRARRSSRTSRRRIPRTRGPPVRVATWARSPAAR